MDPLSITAGAIGIAAPTIHCVRLLVEDIQRIVDAPDTVAALQDDLVALEETLTSLHGVSAEQWKSLGDSVADGSKVALKACEASCDKFRADLARWTRHTTSDGKMSWRDRASVGFLKQGEIKTLSEQLQRCKATLSFAVSTATL